MTKQGHFLRRDRLPWEFLLLDNGKKYLILRFIGPSLLVLLAIGIQVSVRSLIGGKIFFLLYPAIFVGALLGGLIPGLVATFLASLGAWYFFVPRTHVFGFQQTGDIFGLIVFSSLGIVFSVFSQVLRSTRTKEIAAQEERSRLLDKLETTDRLKTQFFSNVSHELRTPLTLILGPAENLLKEKNLSDKSRESLEVVIRNVRTLLRQVNDLLDVARLEAGRMKVNYEKTDLAQLLKSMCSNFDSFVKERGFQFVIKTPNAVPAELEPDKVCRIILNLLSNAFKFTPAGGVVRCTLTVKNNHALLEVADSGPGIPLEIRERIFERFFQAEEGSTRRFGGTGLGLAIAKEFAELHDGNIKVDTAPEGGSLFSVELPLKAPAHATVRPETSQMHNPILDLTQQVTVEPTSNRPADLYAQSRRPSILVVEDNIEMNRFICETLRRDLQTISAYNGKEGLEKTIQREPDLILSDEMMPVMSGSQMIREIRSHNNLKQIPIIMLTAKADEELRIKMLREGISDYVLKPFSSEELLARVNNLVKMKLAEEQLTKSEYKFRTLLESAQDAMCLVNSKGEIEQVNKQVENWFGYEPQELLGQPIEILIPERYRETHVEKRNQYLSHAHPRSMGSNIDLWARKKDGTEIPVDISLTPIQTDKRLLVAAAIRDMTERKRIESEQRFLSESAALLAETVDYQDRLQKIANLVVPRLCDWCLVFILQDQKLRAKAAAHRDPSKAQLLFETAEKYLLKENPLYGPTFNMKSNQSQLVETVTDDILKAIAVDDTHLSELRKINIGSFIGVPLKVRGKTIGALSLAMSGSGRKFTKDDLIFAELVASRSAMAADNARLYKDAQDAIQARDNVLEVVSHDLKNPLTAIQTGIQVIPRMISNQGEKERAQQITNGVKTSGKRMLRMIDDLLDSSKIQAGTLVIETRAASIKEILDELIPGLLILAQEKSIDLKYELPRDLPKIQCDPDRIGQVFSNVISNAIKFTPKHGKIIVSAISHDKVVECSVSDTGPGIPTEEIPYVFDRFWQARRTGHLGTGLGLSIAKGFVEAHGGSIWAESKVGTGSVFYFTVPIAHK